MKTAFVVVLAVLALFVSAAMASPIDSHSPGVFAQQAGYDMVADMSQPPALLEMAVMKLDGSGDRYFQVEFHEIMPQVEATSYRQRVRNPLGAKLQVDQPDSSVPAPIPPRPFIGPNPALSRRSFHAAPQRCTQARDTEKKI